jgi:hypothetical protein
MQHNVAAAIVDDKRILLVNTKHVWHLPNGALRSGVNQIDVLTEAVERDLCGTGLEWIRHYRDFVGFTRKERHPFVTHVYLADVKGGIRGVSGEVREYQRCEYGLARNVSDVTGKVVEALRIDGYL